MSEYTAGQVERAAGSMRVRSSDELEVERMLCAYAATLRQQPTNTPENGSKLVGGGAVSDEVVGAAWNAYEQSMSRRERFTQAYKRIAMRAALEAVAPLLRAPAERMEDARCPPTYRREEAVKTLIALGWAWDGKDWIAPTPAEQGGGVDFSEADGAALRSLKVGEVLTQGQWESACRFVRHQDDIIRNLRAALAQNAKGVMGDMVNLRDEAGALCNRMRDRIAELEAQNAQGEAVAGPISRDGIREMVIRLRNEDSTDDLCVEAADMLATILHAERARVPTDSMLAAFVHTWNGGVEWLPATPNLTKRQLARARMAYNAFLAAAPSQPEDAA